MKRSENGKVTPFEKFVWDNSKSKLIIKLPPKAIENPVLLCIEFGKNSECFYLGEEKAIRQIAENPDLLPKYKGSVLMLSEERPLGSLLMDSHNFITNGLQWVMNIFRSMIHSIDSGNSEKASDYKMLEKLWQEGNAFQRIVINHLFCKFYQVKHLAANGTAGFLAYTAERRREMYSDLERSMEQEFALLAHNPTTLSELKQLHYYKSTDLGDKIFCPNLAEFYVQYISYLSDHILFFRVCPRCGEPFFASTSRRRYHNECAKLQDKDNKLRSQHELERDNFYKQCQEERYRYNNFRRGKIFRDTSPKLQSEYLALFEKFKSELAKQKKKLQGNNATVSRARVNTWLNKIIDERAELERKF
ncbi:MAG: hypothetical protein K2J76_09835 [Oscillospiraceae bacterium]|nr:hypothetical protein [Oscillospiraceae bacterium]